MDEGRRVRWRRCGKSSICRRLQASDKRFKLMSLDDLIVYEADGASIPEIVEERGWTGFRDVEYLVRSLFSPLVPPTVQPAIHSGWWSKLRQGAEADAGHTRVDLLNRSLSLSLCLSMHPHSCTCVTR